MAPPVTLPHGASAAGVGLARAISVRNLTIGYDTRVLLESASFDVQRGEILVILGGSGSGKSSLMKNLIGLYQPMTGDVLIDGQNIVKAHGDEKARLQRKLGIMYQSGALFGSLTTLENVRFPLDQFTAIALHEKNLTARMLLHQVEMGYAEALMPAQLSGGMLKRAGIARAMALGADILMLDEPSAGLDPITAANLDRTILSLRANLGFTFVVVTHEPTGAARDESQKFVEQLFESGILPR
jgi:phospholipid/cholesterol/gamma-HCH transport system ATP-binding protein